MEEYNGLSSAAVLQRIKQGLVNKNKSGLTKSYGRIIRDNTFTAFNFFNLVIFVALLLVQSYSNLLFMGVALINWAVAIYQEIRVKILLEKLQLLNKAEIEVIRDNSWQRVKSDKLVQDDIIKLKSGQQVPCDVIILDGQAEVNEALLTGEADNVYKKKNDSLLSGSYLVSGEIIAVIEHCGEKSFANSLINQARNVREHQSQLIKQLDQIVKITGYFIIPVALLMIFFGLKYSEQNIEAIIASTAGAIIGMMPRGLVLLTTLSLMVGVLHLASKNTLVNELSSIETLARVDTLFMDKTGTLTTGKMKLVRTEDLQVEDLATVLGSILRINQDENATITAIKAQYSLSDKYQGKIIEAFSSARKYSSVLLYGKGIYFLGAADVLFKDKLPFILSKNEERQRLLVLAKSPNIKRRKLHTQEDLQAIALFILQEELRSNVKEIISYFYKNDIDIRILSGDHPLTVSKIAEVSGIKSSENYVDLSLQGSYLDSPMLNKTIYGRATPFQKEQLIEKVQELEEKTVAMCGDGINDVSALRAADCSISFLNASDAAREVSQLVLLDNDFACLPTVMAEGRRVINNITMVASLYLIKTIFSLLLALICVLTMSSFPFEPLHLTILGVFGCGLPSFFLALKANEEKVKKDFIATVFNKALPTALLIVIFFLVFRWLGLQQNTTLLLMTSGFVWWTAVMDLCWPLENRYKALGLAMGLGFYSSIFILRDLLALQALTLAETEIFVVALLITIPLKFILTRGLQSLHYYQKKSRE